MVQSVGVVHLVLLCSAVGAAIVLLSCLITARILQPSTALLPARSLAVQIDELPVPSCSDAVDVIHAPGPEIGVDPVVAFTMQHQRRADEALEVLSRPLERSDSCKSREDEIAEFCEGSDAQKSCDVVTDLATGEYRPLPEGDVAPRCKTLWFSGVVPSMWCY